MTTELEADLRREFDAASMPGGLTFSPESIVRQGNRTIRRRRLIAAGSAAIVVVLAVTGASLLTRPDDRAAPQPATRTATTGIVLGATAHMWGGQSEVRFNRDPRVQSNVSFSVLGKDGKRHELGVASTSRPGQAPTAVWKSAMVDGHPITIGLIPSPARNLEVTFAGSPYGISVAELKGTDFVTFSVDYTLPDKVSPNAAVSGPVINGPRPQEATRTSQIASISWSGPTGIVDGMAGDQRLTGRVLNIDKSVAVKVVLRPGDGGRTTVSGQVWIQTGLGVSSYSSFLSMSVAASDPSGAAVVTGRQPIVGVTHAGPPIAAGILSPGSSGIGVILTTDAVVRPIIVSKRLNDGRVIFALKVASTKATDLGKDSIKAVTWTNADGTKGRMNVTQKES
jgi:hypothetical protein